MNTLDSFIKSFLENIINFLPNIVSSIVILAVGLWIIRLLKRMTHRILTKKKIDPTSISFLLDGAVWGLRIVLFIIIASKLGIQTSSFVAIIGAMSLAIGLSLQGSLSNFAGGVLIILFKPFRIGDIIEAQGEAGKVSGIHIFSTKIINYQNQVIYIPNGVLSNGKIKNYSENDLRKTELSIQTPSTVNSAAFINQLTQELVENEIILKQPRPRVQIKEILDTKVTYSILAWVENESYSEASSFIYLKGKEISQHLASN